MVRRMGRFGAFLGCSDYPKCKTIKSIDVKLNMKCPKCGMDLIPIDWVAKVSGTLGAPHWKAVPSTDL